MTLSLSWISLNILFIVTILIFFQGIIHGELSVSSSILFTQAMTELLHIIEIGTSLKSKIHAYNILRALYWVTKLAEVVHPFIADGLRLAIIGTRSSLWIVSYDWHSFVKYQALTKDLSRPSRLVSTLDLKSCVYEGRGSSPRAAGYLARDGGQWGEFLSSARVDPALSLYLERYGSTLAELRDSLHWPPSRAK